MIVNDHFTTVSLLIHLHKPVAVAITINNSAIVIIFNITSILIRRGTALTLFIETVDKGLLKYEVENIRWWYMTHEHGKQ